MQSMYLKKKVKSSLPRKILSVVVIFKLEEVAAYLRANKCQDLTNYINYVWILVPLFSSQIS